MIDREPSGTILLSLLTPDQRAALDASMNRIHYAAGSVIFRAGDPGDRCFFVDEGIVRLELPHPEVDADLVLAYVEPGELLGELSILDQQQRSVTAYAHRATDCRVLTRTALEDLCNADPLLGMTLMTGLGRQAAARLRETNVRFAADALEARKDPQVERQVRRAEEAQEAFVDWPEARVDTLLRGLAALMSAEARAFAEETVRETALGNVEDKVHKNILACEGILPLLEGKIAHGEIGRDGDVVEIASPIGVVFAILPITNPVAAAIFKMLVCIKTRNAVILSFHRAAARVGARAAGLAREALRAYGAPEDLVQVVEGRSSRRQTQQFMRHPKVSLILATGGPDMVKAAYSSGTPALGVGAGNAPVWICPDTDPDRAARYILQSKTYDNGIICGSEHNLVVDRAIVGPLVKALERHGAAVLDAEETQRALSALTVPGTGQLRRPVLGQPGERLAEVARITRPYPIRLLVLPVGFERLGTPLAQEKLAPMLSLFTVDGDDQGINVCLRILTGQGAGHTAVIHTEDEGRIRRFGLCIPAGRLLVNTPATHGMLGVTTGLPLSFMLGCGTFGGNTTTDAINYRHLLNIKRLALGRPVPG